MTPEQWRRVFEAGMHAAGMNGESSAAIVLTRALHAMEQECRALAREGKEATP